MYSWSIRCHVVHLLIFARLDMTACCVVDTGRAVGLGIPASLILCFDDATLDVLAFISYINRSSSLSSDSSINSLIRLMSQASTLKQVFTNHWKDNLFNINIIRPVNKCIV